MSGGMVALPAPCVTKATPQDSIISAAAFYEEAIRAQPARMPLRLSLADLYRSMGRADKALANAPVREGDYFRVPKILES
jgi:hypothetical protein